MVSSTPRPKFTPGKDTVPIVQEAGWDPGPVWTGGKSRPHRDSIPERPACSQSLNRLSYRAHRLKVLWNANHRRNSFSCNLFRIFSILSLIRFRSKYFSQNFCATPVDQLTSEVTNNQTQFTHGRHKNFQRPIGFAVGQVVQLV